MKTLLLILTLGLAAMLPAFAQTNNVPTNGAPGFITGLPSTILGQFGSLSLSNGVRFGPLALRLGNCTGFGGFVSTAQTNGFNVGVAIVDLQENVKNLTTGKTSKKWNVYDAQVNAQYSGTMTLPLIGLEVVPYFQTGPAFDLKHANTVYEQSSMGIGKDFVFTKNLDLDLGGGPGHFSKYSGQVYYEGHVLLTLKFGNGKGFLGMF